MVQPENWHTNTHVYRNTTEQITQHKIVWHFLCCRFVGYLRVFTFTHSFGGFLFVCCNYMFDFNYD